MIHLVNLDSKKRNFQIYLLFSSYTKEFVGYCQGGEYMEPEWKMFFGEGQLQSNQALVPWANTYPLNSATDRVVSYIGYLGPQGLHSWMSSSESFIYSCKLKYPSNL